MVIITSLAACQLYKAIDSCSIDLGGMHRQVPGHSDAIPQIEQTASHDRSTGPRHIDEGQRGDGVMDGWIGGDRDEQVGHDAAQGIIYQQEVILTFRGIGIYCNSEEYN